MTNSEAEVNMILTAYHGSKEEFTVFDLDKVELGLHVGSINQAYSAAERVTRGMIYMYEVTFVPKSTLRLKDQGNWDPYFVLSTQLYEMGIISKSEYGSLDNRADKKALTTLLRRLILLKYDSIVYLNRYEPMEIAEYVLRNLSPNCDIRLRLDNEGLYVLGDEHDGETCQCPMIVDMSDEEFLWEAPEAEDSYIILDRGIIRSWRQLDGLEIQKLLNVQ